MQDSQTIAIHASEESYQIVRYEKVEKLTLAVQQLIMAGDCYGLHEDPLGNVICVDLEGSRYPAFD